MSLLASVAGGVAGGIGLLLLLILIPGAFLFYFIPTIIAFMRNKSNKMPIFALNLFLGWSLIGWVVSLVWALTKDESPVIVQQYISGGSVVAPPPPAPPPAQPGAIEPFRES